MSKDHFSYSAPMRSSFGGSGRFAGVGTAYDYYSDEYTDDCSAPIPSGCKLPHDGMSEEMWKSLNGECVVIQEGKKKG